MNNFYILPQNIFHIHSKEPKVENWDQKLQWNFILPKTQNLWNPSSRAIARLKAQFKALGFVSMDLGERIKNKASKTNLDVASIEEKASVTSHGTNLKGSVCGEKS